MLDYKLLQALAAVVDEGGFERAARVLHVTQSAVSQRIKLLEEQAGQVLLVRSAPPRPTEAGIRLLKHFRQVRRLEDDLGLEMNLDAGAGDESARKTTISMGINADSLATWFLESVRGYLQAEPVLLDLRADDQEETHKLLRDGEVLGCITSRSEPFQGCRSEYLGSMTYRLMGSSGFRDRWFPDGFTEEAVRRAPMLIFNRKDHMHDRLLEKAFGHVPPLNPFYAPSSGRFADFAEAGLAAAMLPGEQYGEYLAEGRLVDVAPGFDHTVRLHWHCWNIDSPVLAGFTRALARGARRLLQQEP
ncbi:LysR family transcriptional regulator ArgP [Salidesulfovibrio onnuriiensis]|uniref:LysR family transcriptional regulator ArgP n=1 Tax=Salidesulfovibrio onnuriiensis TaxID=2583823 RepID=UPI0011CC15F0|nr:LysR family transcriptional regulator ArgP [Salidesulfovibrio onnuriiensis]